MNKNDMLTVERLHNNAVTVSAMVQDGKACGVFRMQRTYYGHTKAEARKLFLNHLYGNGGQLDE